MSNEDTGGLHRREFLGLLGAAGAGIALGAGIDSLVSRPAHANEVISFHGVHQAGIADSPQQFLHFAVFDVLSDKRSDITSLLQSWTRAAEMLTVGDTVSVNNSSGAGPADSGETSDLGPNRLTLTFGFGPSFFSRSGADRFGLKARQPPALVDLPPFKADDIDPVKTGGDICVQACADNPQVAFHAVRSLLHIAAGSVVLRWSQRGFAPASVTTPNAETPRNLFGQKDGTNNIKVGSVDFDPNVWVTGDWLRDGTYLIARRIRMVLDLWDRTPLGTQDQLLGRVKSSGAPLGGSHEHDKPNLSAKNSDGSFVIPLDAHIRVASAVENSGTRILRRGYSFDDGVDDIQKLDAGLFFICFQRDPSQFVTLQQHLSNNDAMHHFLRHTASGVFACPPGISSGGWIGQTLFS